MKPTCLFFMIAVAATAAQVPPPEPPTAEEKREIEKKMAELATRVATLAARKVDLALLADVDVYRNPNPLNPKRYVVINSGHTFGEADFRGTNAWLYPRLGDYSVLKPDGEVVLSGFFNENWQFE